MSDFNGQELCRVVCGKWVNRSRFSKSLHAVYLKGVSIDSREKDLEGKIFVAIQGSQFNGHHFIREVVQKKAGAVVIHSGFSLPEDVRSLCEKFSPVVIAVENTLQALQALAKHWRKNKQWKVIGITGSVGKTTTKHFCLRLLERYFSVQASPKSFNNQYGVPLGLLSADRNLDFLIQEIGMNQKGEVAFLSNLIQPDIAVVVEVGHSHIGLLGSKQEIAYEKEQIYANTHPQATWIFNWDNSHTQAMYQRAQRLKHSGRIMSFSNGNKKADIFLKVTKVGLHDLQVEGHLLGERGSATVPVVGSVNVYNLMAASAIALDSGLKPSQVWETLPLCVLPSARRQWVSLSCGAKALFDAYNAGPESVMALLDYFFSSVVCGKKILILGDFLELGFYLETFYRQLAIRLKNYQQNCLKTQELVGIWFIGSQEDLFKKALLNAGFCLSKTWVYFSKKDNPAIAEKICCILDPSFVLALKASRKMRLEKTLLHFQPVDFNVL